VKSKKLQAEPQLFYSIEIVAIHCHAGKMAECFGENATFLVSPVAAENPGVAGSIPALSTRFRGTAVRYWAGNHDECCGTFPHAY
jgi:hypothetical protein